ncbi:putative mitochondrial hypothetical protein [Leptomonas pyrrhocoris]|uniref:Uncharacterized protein n=1 Tax=Leptomonas pyrrhocoris TaxID=157538 RepID=A0A0N0DQS8_LEPPY|nr:putative mitochondrial hypothetical protein [Leptomonas pyrrhocoris]KPA73422.1 putative mitochondrial hypothetical protein [Leptomonas pyrrhocoris]|eukprot:XP_015651861.1 putative mitochondrial hypothetical protein [Leptomonas pyrrhocoris]
MRRSTFATGTAAAAAARRLSPLSSLQCTATTPLLASRRWRSSRPPRHTTTAAASKSAAGASFLSHPSPESTSPYQTGPTSRQSRTAANHTSGLGRGPVKDRIPPVPTDLVDPRRRLAVLVDGSNLNVISDGCTSMEQLYRTSALFSTVLPAVLMVGVPVLLRVFAHQLPSAWEPLIAGNSSRFGGHHHNSSSSEDASLAERDMDGVEGSAGEEAANGGSGGNGGGGEGFGMEGGAAAGSPSSTRPLSLIPLPAPSATPSALSAQPRVQVEYFRVERFIPIAMQLEADARHLYELRSLNKIEGVCYVCHEVDRAMYVSLMEEQRNGSAALAGLLRHNSGEASTAAATPAAFFNQYVFDELGMVGELLADGRSKDGS